MKKQTEIEEIRKTGEQDCEKLPNQAGNIRKKYTKIVEKFYTLCYNKTIGKISEGKGVRMMKRKSLQTALLAAVMGVVSMPHAVLAADAPSEAAAAVNVWIGYQVGPPLYRRQDYSFNNFSISLCSAISRAHNQTS